MNGSIQRITKIPSWRIILRVLSLFVVLLLISASAGCLNRFQHISSGDTAYSGNQSLQGEGSVHVDAAPSLTPTIIPAPTVSLTHPAGNPATVLEVPPVITPDPYPVMHATRVNSSPSYDYLADFYSRTPVFTRTYTLRGNSTGLLIDAARGPLWIKFDVSRLDDCLKKPESCRGTLDKAVSRPYLRLTVRDNQTGKIVAEDGYGQEYSGQISDRFIVIYRDGQYHLTLTGNYLDAKITIATGASLISNVPGTVTATAEEE